MRHRNRAQTVVLAFLLMVIAGCGSAAVADELTTTTTTAVETTPTTTDIRPTTPDPDFAWAFDGDGKASLGGIDVEFAGAYETTAQAVAFDGHTGHGATIAPGPLDTTASFTVSTWVNYGARSEIAAAVSQLGTITGLFQLGIGDRSQWWFMMKTEDQTGLEHAVWAESPETAPGNSWTHLVGVSDQEAGVIRLYIDGEKQAETPFDAPLRADGPLTIGRSQFDSQPGNFWPGAIASVAIYQTALTDDQIAELHEGTRPTSARPPMPAPDPSTYADGILNGTWDAVLNKEDGELATSGFIAEGLIESADEVTVRIGFDDHEWWLGFLFDGELYLEPGGVPAGAGGTFLIEGDVMISSDFYSYVVQTWALDGDRLTFELIEFCWTDRPEPLCAAGAEIAEIDDPVTVMLSEQTYTKSSDDPSY